MISLLSRLFIKDYENTSDPGVRQRYGVLCGGLGIFLNYSAFPGKAAGGIFQRLGGHYRGCFQ